MSLTTFGSHSELGPWPADLFMPERRRYSSGSPYEPVIGFSRAVRVDDTIYVSGTGPIGAEGKTVGVDDAAAQARRCWEIILEAIENLGGKPEDVVRVRTYLTHASDWEAVGRVQGETFGEIRPAATMVVAGGLLDPDWRVEIEAEAVVSQ